MRSTFYRRERGERKENSHPVFTFLSMRENAEKRASISSNFFDGALLDGWGAGADQVGDDDQHGQFGFAGGASASV